MATKKIINEFIIWKDNKISGEQTISVQDASEKFKKSKFYEYYQKGWPLLRALLVFIGAPEEDGGLSSVIDQDQSDDIYEAIRHELKETTTA